MPRRKLSEYRAKKIVTDALAVPYVGWSVTAPADAATIKGYDRYVVKVDQAVKGRFKKGLVMLNVAQKDLKPAIEKLQKKGYSSFIVEPETKHEVADERYLALAYDRRGETLSYSRKGGVDIESNAETIRTVTIDKTTDWTELEKETGIAADKLRTLYAAFKKDFCTLMEINPYVVEGDRIHVLDSAIEVDDAGAYFTDAWTDDDIRTPMTRNRTASEEVVLALDAKSPASFNLSVLNPDGTIFLLLSGGGASVVIADEISNVGLGGQLANYGEYSGNPNTQETYLYTAEVIKLLLASKASRKVLFIGGAVANFTDIANTFAGIIKVIDEYAPQLKKQQVKMYVRRGGPRQEIGLDRIRLALEKHGMLGGVFGPETSITQALNVALEEVW